MQNKINIDKLKIKYAQLLNFKACKKALSFRKGPYTCNIVYNLQPEGKRLVGITADRTTVTV